MSPRSFGGDPGGEALPAAASLLENFELDPLAVAVQAVAIDAGANSDAEIAAAAAEWIPANRDKIGPWIEAAPYGEIHKSDIALLTGRMGPPIVGFRSVP
ncbi:MAG: hypothetical protein OXK16_05395 [bacterium]|nr:hypothetical protein [bacterium]